jgi:hypothetical protein
MFFGSHFWCEARMEGASFLSGMRHHAKDVQMVITNAFSTWDIAGNSRRYLQTMTLFCVNRCKASLAGKAGQ